MHLLVIIGLVCALIAFVFGTQAARVFAGAMLGLVAFGFLALVGVAALDISRQASQPQIVHMAPGK